MKIKWGLILAWGAGSIGGGIAGYNHHSSTFRVKPACKYSGSNYKVPTKYRLTKFGKLWSKLHVEERIAWINYARSFEHLDGLGNTVYPSGYNEYIAINSNLELIGLTPLSYPLPRSSVNPSVLFSVSSSQSSGIIIDFSTLPDQSDFAIIVKSCGPVRIGQFYNANLLVNIEILPTLSVNNYDLTNSYKKRFGLIPSPGFKLFFAVQLISKYCGCSYPAVIVQSIITN